jgi:hypothetical protein
MPVDLSPYQVAGGEKPASSAKQNNTIQAIQDALNSIPPAQIVGYPGSATSYLDGSGHWSAPPITVFPVTVLGKWTQKVVTNPGGVDLLNNEITIPAGAFTAQGAINCWWGGTFVNNSGANWTFALELRLGGNLLWQSGQSPSISTHSYSRAWWFRAACQGLSTGNVRSGGYFGLSAVAAPAIGKGYLSDTYPGISLRWAGTFWQGIAVDMTVAQPLTFAVSMAGSTGTVTMNLDYARVEVS